MTTSHDPATGESASDPVALAIAALTAAARTHSPGRPTADTHADFSTVIAEVLCATAANLGSMDAMFAGRWPTRPNGESLRVPTGYELYPATSLTADLVRQIITSHLDPAGRYLWACRTEPVRVHFSARWEFDLLGLQEMIDGEVAAVRLAAGATAGAQGAEALAVGVGELRALYEADLVTYAAAFVEMARAAVDEWAPGVELEVVDADPTAEITLDDDLSSQVHFQAQMLTPLPATGLPPTRDDEIREPEDLRVRRRTWTDRVNEDRARRGEPALA